MIIDTLANSTRYESLNPYFKQAFDFLKKTDLSKLEIGKKIVLDGDNLFINVNEGAGKEKNDAKLEDGHAPGIATGNLKKLIVKVIR